MAEVSEEMARVGGRGGEEPAPAAEPAPRDAPPPVTGELTGHRHSAPRSVPTQLFDKP